MSVKLITGIPNAGKTTWTNEHYKDGVVIHTDDLYYSRYRDVPEHIKKKSWNILEDIMHIQHFI